MEWSDRAACAGADAEQFFPIGAGPSASWETAAAKQICGRCEVIDDCRDYALRTRQTFGVWGGLDEEERRSLLSGTASAVR